MSSSLFANVLQQNKPPPKRREAYAADGGGGGGGDPLSGVPDNTTDPRAVTESKYGRNVRGQVGKSGRGSSRRVAPVNGSPDKYNGVMPQSTPERMMGNAPLEVDDLADLTGGTGGNEAVVAQARRGRGRDDGASAQSPTAARKGRGQMVQASEPGTPDKYSDRNAPGGVPGGLPGGRGVGLAPLVRSGWGSGLLVCRADFCASLHKKKGRTLVCVLPFLVTLPRGSCA